MATTKTGMGRKPFKTWLASEKHMILHQELLTQGGDLLLPQPDPTKDGTTAKLFTNDEVLTFIWNKRKHTF